MADGSRVTSRRRNSFRAQFDADPRFAMAGEAEGRPERRAGASPVKTSEGKSRPRIAFTGEEFGFGYQATSEFVGHSRKIGTVPDAGLSSWATTEREFKEASKNNRFDYDEPVPQPLRTKEQALLAVQQGTADFALIPFYNPYAGYDFESLRALGSLFTLRGVLQVEATDKLCLAVHESQLYDIVQSAHPGTGFSALQRRLRKSWGTVDSGSGNKPAEFDAEMPRAGLPIDMGDQKLIRDRIDVVFAGPEAARRCKSRLDGMRAIGVAVEEIPQMVEPHRELARRARGTLNGSRQTNTLYDPITGETRFYSTLGAEAQDGKLYGMVLPYEVAMRSSDYIIIDHDFDDAPGEKTRFMAVEINPDETLYEDAYRTTDAKTRYWVNRLRKVAAGTPNFASRTFEAAGGLLALIGIIYLAVGLPGMLGNPGVPVWEAPAWMVFGSDLSAAAIGAAFFVLGVAGLIAGRTESMPPKGVRVMLKFRRDSTAASIGDVENFLRNYGVRHAVTRLDEDSERDRPSSIMLDVEFDAVDFRHDILSMISRRLRGSVVNGAMKKAFQRWKNRGVLVMAAMPIEEGQAQLPKQKQRRWWNEALVDWAMDFVETMFIRLSRLLVYLIPVALAAYLVWNFMAAGK
ncbi:MAG TPA: hypothetical protein PKH09_03605 [Parvularculaceae bacterium]|nr:hypothetical protein [Parvularculaceae bacterium]